MKYQWGSLTEAPGWLELWEAPDSPIRQRIDSLTKETQDINVVDPVASMRARAMLHGILEVKRAVDEAARAESAGPLPGSEPEPFRNRALRLSKSLSKSLLPRRLG